MIPPWFITQNRQAFGDSSSARDVRSGTGSLPNKTDVFLGMHACFTSRQIDKKGSLTVADWCRTFWYWYNRSGFLGHAACDVRIINDNAQSVRALLDQEWFQGAPKLPWSFKGMKRDTVQGGGQSDWYTFNGSFTPKIRGHQHDAKHAKLLAHWCRMTVELLLLVRGPVPLARVEETKAYLYARSDAWIWTKTTWY